MTTALTAPALIFGDGQPRRLSYNLCYPSYAMLDGTSEPVTPTSGELPSDEGMKPSRFRLGRVIGVSPELPVGARVLARLADPKGPRCKRYVPCVLFLTLGNKQVRRTGVCRSALSLSASFIVYVSCDNCHGVSLFPLFLPPRILT